MLEADEQLLEAAAEFQAPEVSLAHPESEPHVDVATVEHNLFEVFSSLSDKVPDWVPVIAPFLKAKKAQWEAGAAFWRNTNLATGEKFTNTGERMKQVGSKFLSGFFQEGMTAVDLLLLFGTGGSGNVAFGAEKMAAQKVVGSAGKITMEGVSTALSKLANGGESALIDLIPGFFKGMSHKVAEHPEAAKYLLEAGTAFEKLEKIPGARLGMEQFVANQAWWQKGKESLQSSQGRVARATGIIQAVNNSRFSPEPTSA